MSSLPLSCAIKNDHIMVNELYRNYLMNQGNLAQQSLYSFMLLQELTKHAFAEEAIVYPAFEQYLGPEGKMMADKDRSEHQLTKQLMCFVKVTPVSDPQHCHILSALMNNLNLHVVGEETHDLPLLESAIAPAGSAYLAHLFQQTKLYVPIF